MQHAELSLLFLSVGILMCHMIVSVTISRWFVRKRGRAIAVASMGQGFAKVCIPVLTAALFTWIGWQLLVLLRLCWW